MSLQRLLPDRWARIVAWTAAAVVWGTTAVAASAGAASDQGGVADPGPAAAPVSEPSPTTTHAPMPAPTKNGLIIIRYSPVEPPPPQVITRTVTRSATSAPAPPAPVVQSSGS